MDFLVFPTPEDIKRDILSGKLKRAKMKIKERLEHKIPHGLNKKLHFELYRILLLRKTYSITKERAFQILKKRLRNLKKSEFEMMMSENVLEWMYIDDVPYFENRFDSNLFFNYPKFKDRQKMDYDFRLANRRRAIINKSITKLIDGGKPTKFQIRAKITLKRENPTQSKVRVWLPFPKEAYQQSDVELILSSHDVEIAPNNVGQRTVYMEGFDSENFYVEFVYKIQDWIGFEGLYRDNPTKEDLSEKLPHIRFTPYLWNLIDLIFHGEDLKNIDDITKARRIYDFITLNVNYSYVLPYALYDNIPEYVATVFKGDCGFQALLFITLCRMVGVPARWQSGWSITPLIASPHDWAIIYLEKYGWVPVDLSFGGGRRENEGLRLFYFTNLDGFRMIANTEFQSDFVPNKLSWRLDPYDNQSGEMEVITKEEDGYVIDLESKIEVIEFKKVKS
ncbi:MAG: transglutaminase-like domain-containing protein [Fervidobacterium sp.]